MPKNRPNMQPVKVPTYLHQRMKIQAAIERTTIQELTEKALLAYLDEHGKARLLVDREEADNG